MQEMYVVLISAASMILGGLVITVTSSRKARNLLQRISIQELELKQSAEIVENFEKVKNDNGQLKIDIADERRALANATQRITELQQDNESLQHEQRTLVQKGTELEVELGKLQASQKERERSFEQQMLLLDKNKQELVKEFELLSKRALEEHGKTLLETNQRSVSGLMQPLKVQLTEFKSRAEQIHEKNVENQTSLQAELKLVQETGLRLSDEAKSLAIALRGQKKMQGNWGELILESVLDSAGLVKDVNYRREVVLTKEGEKVSRPDVVIDLPNDRHLIIDAKVSLNAYTRFVNATDELERNTALNEHVSAVKSHIKALSNKDYSNLIGVNSPPIVFMFVPIESAFVAAVKHDSEIYQSAVSERILVATPTTLLTSLNIVKQLWNFETQNLRAKELTAHAEKVFNKTRLFLESFVEVGRQLEKAQTTYSTAQSRLTDGKGNLVKVVTEFKELVPAISNDLPGALVERASLELEYEGDGGNAEG